MKAYGGIRSNSTHSHTSTRWRCVVNLMPQLLSPWGNSPSYTLNSSLVGLQGQFGHSDMRIPCSCLESGYDSLVVHHTNYINYRQNVKYIYKYLPQGVGLHSAGVDEKSACVAHGNSGYVKFGFQLNGVVRRKSHSSSSTSVRSRNWSSWNKTEYEKYKNVKRTSDIHSCASIKIPVAAHLKWPPDTILHACQGSCTCLQLLMTPFFVFVGGRGVYVIIIQKAAQH